MIFAFLGLSGVNTAMAIVVFGILIAMAIAHSLQNSVDVKAGVEWAVIADINGNLDALGYGTHSIPPGWKEVDRIPTNVQEMVEKGEEVGTSQDNVSIALDEFVTFCAGHQLRKREKDDWYEFVDLEKPDKKTVILASNKIDSGKITELSSIREMVGKIVDAAFEEVFRMYTPDQILNTKHLKPADLPWVPHIPMPELPKREQIGDTDELHRRLAIMVKNIANQQLWKYGLAVIDIRITNLRYFSAKLQAAAESGQEKLMIARNMEKVLEALPKDGKISLREAILLGDPTYADVAVAQLNKEAAKLLAKGGISAGAAMLAALNKLVAK